MLTTASMPAMSDKKQVLFVVPQLGVGGVSRSLLALLREFPFERWEVSILLFSKENALLDQLPPQVRVQYSAAMVQQEKIRGAVSYLLQRGPLRPLFRWAKGLYHRFGGLLTARDSAINSYDVAVAYQDGMATWFVARNVPRPGSSLSFKRILPMRATMLPGSGIHTNPSTESASPPRPQNQAFSPACRNMRIRQF